MVSAETIEALSYDMMDSMETLSRCLNDIRQENPIMYQWILNVKNRPEYSDRQNTDCLLHLVLQYKMLQAQIENDKILDSLK